jgi:hypothetical protein
LPAGGDDLLAVEIADEALEAAAEKAKPAFTLIGSLFIVWVGNASKMGQRGKPDFVPVAFCFVRTTCKSSETKVSFGLQPCTVPQ